METIKLEKDYGADAAHEKWNGNFLTEDAYEQVISPTVDTAIYKPGASLFENIPLAYVVCDAYPDDQVFECLKTVSYTHLRAHET